MLNAEKNRLQKISDFEQTPPAERNTAKTFLSEFSPVQIKEALLPDLELTCPFDELISIGEAVFEFIRHSEMELKTKNAFCQLEKQFEFYKNLLLL